MSELLQERLLPAFGRHVCMKGKCSLISNSGKLILWAAPRPVSTHNLIAQLVKQISIETLMFDVC